MRLSDFTGDSIFDLIAEVVEPAAKLFSDKRIKECLYPTEKDEDGNSIRDIAGAVKIVCGEYKREIMEILAALNKLPVDEYKPTLAELAVQTMFLFKDLTADVITVFTSSELKTEKKSFGSAMENTTEIEN